MNHLATKPKSGLFCPSLGAEIVKFRYSNAPNRAARVVSIRARARNRENAARSMQAESRARLRNIALLTFPIDLAFSPRSSLP